MPFSIRCILLLICRGIQEPFLKKRMELSRNSLKFDKEIDRYLIGLNYCFPYRFYSGMAKMAAEGLLLLFFSLEQSLMGLFEKENCFFYFLLFSFLSKCTSFDLKKNWELECFQFFYSLEMLKPFPVITDPYFKCFITDAILKWAL